MEQNNRRNQRFFLFLPDETDAGEPYAKRTDSTTHYVYKPTTDEPLICFTIKNSREKRIPRVRYTGACKAGIHSNAKALIYPSSNTAAAYFDVALQKWQYWRSETMTAAYRRSCRGTTLPGWPSPGRGPPGKSS